MHPGKSNPDKPVASSQDPEKNVKTNDPDRTKTICLADRGTMSCVCLCMGASVCMHMWCVCTLNR